jgi:hypothetical protein
MEKVAMQLPAPLNYKPRRRKYSSELKQRKRQAEPVLRARIGHQRSQNATISGLLVVSGFPNTYQACAFPFTRIALVLRLHFEWFCLGNLYQAACSLLRFRGDDFDDEFIAPDDALPTFGPKLLQFRWMSKQRIEVGIRIDARTLICPADSV